MMALRCPADVTPIHVKIVVKLAILRVAQRNSTGVATALTQPDLSDAFPVNGLQTDGTDGKKKGRMSGSDSDSDHVRSHPDHADTGDPAEEHPDGIRRTVKPSTDHAVAKSSSHHVSQHGGKPHTWAGDVESCDN